MATVNDIAAKVQEAYAGDVLAGARAHSVALSAFPTINMGTSQHTQKILTATPTAKWMGQTRDSAGQKPTTWATWGDREIVVAEVATIIGLHENDIADGGPEVLDQVINAGSKAIARAIDAAVLFGVNQPTVWSSNSLFDAATASGNLFQVGTGEDDLAGSIYQAAGAVAEAGDPTSIISPKGLRYRVANLRDSSGALLLAEGSLAGLDSYWTTGPVFDRTKAEALVLDAEQVVMGVRQDVTVKVSTDATVDGVSLFEYDHVGLRFVARVGYALASDSAVAAITPSA